MSVHEQSLFYEMITARIGANLEINVPFVTNVSELHANLFYFTLQKCIWRSRWQNGAPFVSGLNIYQIVAFG